MGLRPIPLASRGLAKGNIRFSISISLSVEVKGL
jgi:hypothetical protein